MNASPTLIPLGVLFPSINPPPPSLALASPVADFFYGEMTTAISIEDVHREVKILKALSGHIHLVRFYDACEDANNVYIVMEGGRYTEEDAKFIIVQILSVVAFCHLQGVVHRDLKPENFLFSFRNEDANMKLIDFGLSDFMRPGYQSLPKKL